MPDDPSIIPNTLSDATDATDAADGAGATAATDASDLVALVGDNVRRLRERTGQSLRELAARAAVSTSTLSSLEGGGGNPGVETLVNISRALNVPFSELVIAREPDVRVQRADEGIVIDTADSRMSTRLLVAESGRSITEVYEAAMEPGGPYQAEPHLPGVNETVIVVRGRMRVGPGGATVELGPGDRGTFAADQPHTYEALEPATLAILVLGYR